MWAEAVAAAHVGSHAMEHERFDALTRVLVRGMSRRGAAATFASLMGVAALPADFAAKKKRKTKKRRRNPKPPQPSV
jgi:hypothetical protein